jgi:hypothetical protein
MTLPTSIDPATDLETEATTDDFRINVGEEVAQRFDFDAELEWMRDSNCNVGRTEQKFRIATGSALLAAAAFAPVSRGWRIGFALIGAAELVTGAMRYCPINQALGINTCTDEEW